MSSGSPQEFMTKARAEWAANGRLRVGVYVLLGIFWLYGVLVLKDFVAAEKGVWEGMESKTARARATAAAADWASRSVEMKGAVGDLEALLWKEGSVGLSEASFGERISQSFAQSGVALRSIRTSAVADAGGTAGQLGLIELRARAQVEFRPATFYPWLAMLAKSKLDKAPSIFVEGLTIRAAPPGQQTVELELVAYAVKASANALKQDAASPSNVVPPSGGVK
jgi:hypothetical protein